VASTVLLQLSVLGNEVAQAATSPELRDLLQKEDRPGLQRLAQSWNDAHKAEAARSGGKALFEAWYVLDREGRLVGCGPPPIRDIMGELYCGRDYFLGARRKPDPSLVHISRVFQGHSDNLYKFAISAPVRAGLQPGSEFLGVVAATITTDSDWDLPKLHDGQRSAVLIARQDTNRHDAPLPDRDAALPEEGEARYLVLLHPAYRTGEEPVPIRNQRLQALQERERSPVELRLPDPKHFDSPFARDEQYRDPVATRSTGSQGRWLASFAPVGNSEFTVLVQQPAEEAIGPDRVLTRNLILWVGFALSLGVLFTGAVMWHGARRAERLARQRHPTDGGQR
jgi:hypothetical protein